MDSTNPHRFIVACILSLSLSIISSLCSASASDISISEKNIILTGENIKPVAKVRSTSPESEFKVGYEVIFTGEESYDPVGQEINYYWKSFAKPISSELVFYSSYESSLRFTPDASGLYEFEFHVYDSKGVASEPVKLAVWITPKTSYANGRWEIRYTDRLVESENTQEQGDSQSKPISQYKPIQNPCEELEKLLIGPGPDPFTTMTTLAVTTAAAVVITVLSCIPVSTTNQINKSKSASYNRLQKYRFVAGTRDQLERDFSAGGGEYADALAVLFGCPQTRRAQYVNVVRKDFDLIFTLEETDPGIILKRLEAQITQHPDLSIECTSAS